MSVISLARSFLWFKAIEIGYCFVTGIGAGGAVFTAVSRGKRWLISSEHVAYHRKMEGV